MPQKDYVSRGRANSKPKSKTNNKKTAAKANTKQTKARDDGNSSSILWIRLAIITLILLIFAYWLWSIKDNSGEPDNSIPVEPVVKNTEESLPELPEEEWDYIKTLPGYEVEVDVAEQVKSDKRYLMQCASFRTRPQAEEMRAKIAFQGFEAQIRNSSGKNGDWFRVILGPFDSKRDAERTRHALRKANVTTCQIWFWNL